jgi:SAM-dependent methyltransferase
MESAKSDSQSAVLINDYQKSAYESPEKDMAMRIIARYSDVLEPLKRKGKIKILDIGGGRGFCSLVLREYFAENGCEIVVVDNTRYDTWDEFGGGTIKFIEDSAGNLGEMFSENTFDLIFANYVFHHMIVTGPGGGWRGTVLNITDTVKQVSKVLKNDGVFCVTEHWCDGLLFDKAASAVIYTLTSCKIPLLARIFRRIEAKSAGVGVCFLSKKMWMNIVDSCGFEVDKVFEGYRSPWSFLKRMVFGLLLLMRRRRVDVSIVCKKKR